jgi:hypothetical protein
MHFSKSSHKQIIYYLTLILRIIPHYIELCELDNHYWFIFPSLTHLIRTRGTKYKKISRNFISKMLCRQSIKICTVLITILISSSSREQKHVASIILNNFNYWNIFNLLIMNQWKTCIEIGIHQNYLFLIFIPSQL